MADALTTWPARRCGRRNGRERDQGSVPDLHVLLEEADVGSPGTLLEVVARPYVLPAAEGRHGDRAAVLEAEQVVGHSSVTVVLQQTRGV